jgi:hypothetical protein
MCAAVCGAAELDLGVLANSFPLQLIARDNQKMK